MIVLVLKVLLNLTHFVLFKENQGNLSLNILLTKMRLVDNLIKFAKETSIHGFVQMANSSSSKMKRMSWFILFCSSIIYARYQISDEVKCKYHLFTFFS